VEARVLATLLTEMDGISSGNSNNSSATGGEEGDVRVEESVIVMAATNRIDCIDAALLRKGRFHQTLLVPPPSDTEKIQLLHYFAKRCRLTEGDVQCIRDSEAFKRKGMSGADVEGMCKERLIASVRLPISVGLL
jgi:SpoVK/Ycf46/Vps4 family AAA+-type ATPase